MSPQHSTLKSTFSYQNSAFRTDVNDLKPQYRRAISFNGYETLHEDAQPEEDAPQLNHVSISIPEQSAPVIHRQLKPGRQRLRWNLIFNILLWILCPLPIWLPFLSNDLAIYLLTSIQCVFVSIWLIISFLAGRNAFALFR